MHKRPLSNTDLGKIGEGRFVNLCEEGLTPLIVNRSLRDESGWDFIVEFPINKQSGLNIDKRNNPISARFQQKTCWYDNDRVEFTLSAIERLAKEPGPSFVCILKYDHAIQCTACYLVHIADEILESILKALRKHAATSVKPLNHKKFYLYASRDGHLIGASHQQLVDRIKFFIGDDIYAYYDQKRVQLKSLGFTAESYSMSFSLDDEQNEKMIDAMLGKDDEIRATNLKGTETRFGVSLPIPNFEGSAILKVQAFPIDTAEVIFYEHKFSQKYKINADVYVAPPGISFTNNPKRMRIAGKAVELVLNEHSSTIITKKISPNAVSLSLSEWRAHLNVLLILNNGNAQIDLKINGKTYRGMQQIGKSNIAKIENVHAMLAATETLERLCVDVGYDKKVFLTYQELWLAIRQMNLARKLFVEKISAAADPVDFSSDLTAEMPKTVRGSYITYYDVKDELLVWRCSIMAHRKEGQFDIEFLDPRAEPPELSILDRGLYEEYVQTFCDSQISPLVLHSKSPKTNIA